jgi:hypothetical protein
MFWVIPAAMAAVGALQKGQQAAAAKKANQKAMQANAATMEYSPWTGMKADMIQPSAINVGSEAFGGAMQGGLSGMMMQKEFGKPQASETPMTDQFKAPEFGAASFAPKKNMYSLMAQNERDFNFSKPF